MNLNEKELLIIKDILVFKNLDELEWKEITYRLNQKYNQNGNAQAYRKKYERFCDKHNIDRNTVYLDNKLIKINKVVNKPKVLIFDIETAPILGYVWGLWDNNVALNQIQSDWYILSWSAKWLGDSPKNVMYQDQRNAENIEDDSMLLAGIWELLNEADIVITQNGKKFDVKKLNARFILNGFSKPSSFRHIDTKILASRHFAFTSNKLEYLTDKLCTKYKKLKHAKFSGFELWKQCLKGNLEAWEEMKKYNKYDVLSLEELYLKLQGWDADINFNVYNDSDEYICNCGNTELIENGFYYTNNAKYQKYKCSKCGLEHKSKTNLLSKDKKINMLSLIK